MDIPLGCDKIEHCYICMEVIYPINFTSIFKIEMACSTGSHTDA